MFNFKEIVSESVLWEDNFFNILCKLAKQLCFDLQINLKHM